MRIALVHDYIKEYGGAERVLETLHEIWPKAPVFTTVYLPEFLGPHRDRFDGWDIRTSWLQNIPFIEKLISPARLLTPWVFDNFDLSGFDLVIVSATGAYFPNLLVRKPETVHVCYCHTPPRYLYGYPTAREWKKNAIGRIIGELMNHWLRQVDFLSYQRPDYIISNSNEVRRRVEKFYRREATVIYPPASAMLKALRAGPPVDIKSKIKDQRSKTQIKDKKEQYLLTGGRLARAKHIDLAIEACNKLKLPLKVFGREFAGYGEELRKRAGPTVEFVGEVTEEELSDLYLGAKALIYPSELEDFGIMPVEAQAHGTPVIAYRSGGVKETVIDGKTGIFFDELTVGSLIKAIKAIEQLSHRSIKPEDCIDNAKRFSKERFKSEIIDFINKKSR